MARTLDLQSKGHENSQSGRYQVVTTRMVTVCQQVNHLGI